MIPVCEIKKTTNEQWQELRRSGIGASEVAGVMGYSPWQTPLSIYISKVEEVQVEETLPMELGKELEPFMRRKFLQWLEATEGVTGVEFEPKATYRHEKYPFILCSPDDLFHHPTKGLAGAEYKTASEFKSGEFSDTEIPDQYYLQVQTCMAVTGLSEWYLAYLIGNRKYDVLLIPRNEDVITEILNDCESFWSNYIMTKIPPMATGSPDDTKALQQIYSGGGNEIELLDDEKTYDLLKELSESRKHYEKLESKVKQTLMAAMGDHDKAIFGYKEDGKPKYATWKQMSDTVVKEHVRKGSRVFRVY